MEKTIKNKCHGCEMGCCGCKDTVFNVLKKYPYLTTVQPEQLAELPPIPEGWEFARIGVPEPGELVLCKYEGVSKANYGHTTVCVILKAKRWRAERGEFYWTVDSMGNVITVDESGSKIDQKRWESWVYTKSREEAEAALERMQKVVQG